MRPKSRIERSEFESDPITALKGYYPDRDDVTVVLAVEIEKAFDEGELLEYPPRIIFLEQKQAVLKIDWSAVLCCLRSFEKKYGYFPREANLPYHNPNLSLLPDERVRVQEMIENRLKEYNIRLMFSGQVFFM
ncbi:MAG: hypothetical protein UT34_C0002G0279 [candidate division WS6 bacterium GW2011_GWF2_39_15]|uniref:Uncharacterized protein n=1 Tax=candidate division WS6 bacterium GW2011_GWF2_39_15 TaxID=1619100 RepID=A0A0G0QVX5_9BACT|nr:MAG: hypothetical protein UT34_C0002G0279 [candidate division WS6 bacterium GW2011_GWF2_39_15]